MRTISAMVRRVCVVVCTTAVLVCAATTLIYTMDYALTTGGWAKLMVGTVMVGMWYIAYRMLTWWYR